jgi:hypothetical protein
MSDTIEDILKDARSFFQDQRNLPYGLRDWLGADASIRTFQDFWDRCPRPDWLVWYLGLLAEKEPQGSPAHRLATLAACIANPWNTRKIRKWAKRDGEVDIRAEFLRLDRLPVRGNERNIARYAACHPKDSDAWISYFSSNPAGVAAAKRAVNDIRKAIPVCHLTSSLQPSDEPAPPEAAYAERVSAAAVTTPSDRVWLRRLLMDAHLEGQRCAEEAAVDPGALAFWESVRKGKPVVPTTSAAEEVPASPFVDLENGWFSVVVSPKAVDFELGAGRDGERGEHVNIRLTPEEALRIADALTSAAVKVARRDKP